MRTGVFLGMPTALALPALGGGWGAALYAAAAVILVVAVLVFVLVLQGVGPVFRSDENGKEFRFRPIRDRGSATTDDGA